MAWKLSDLKEPGDLKVFSVFSGGGGSTMGYKLAGFDVIGCCEIDPKMMEVYRANFRPQFRFAGGIQELNKFDDFPQSLFNLDILDGSPPCSSFSFAGKRHNDWGKKKVFREGQADQVLDDLFFEFIELGAKLRPKVIIAENVKALALGKSRGYVKMIFQKLNAAGYDAQLFLLNSAVMGVPQARERTFFVARRRDLNLPKLQLAFREAPIPLKEALAHCDHNGRQLGKVLTEDWYRVKAGEKKKYQSTTIASPDLPSPTLTSKCTSGEGSVSHWETPRKFSVSEAIEIQTFPADYDFLSLDPGYVLGMSVPPMMIKNLSAQIKSQFFL